MSLNDINVNKMVSLTNKEIFIFEYKNSLLTIMKIATGYLSGVLSVHLILRLFDIIIPNSKNKNIIFIIALFIIIIIIIVLASLVFTLNEINLESKKKLNELRK